MWRIACLSVLLVSIIVSLRPAAGGETPAFELVIESPPSLVACVRADSLRAAVASQLGYDPFADQADEELLVILTSEGDGVRAVLRSKDKGGNTVGERAIATQTSDCRELEAAIALALAMSIDPMSPLGTPVIKPPVPSPAPAVPSPPTRQPVIAKQPLLVPEEPITWMGAVGVLGTLGVTPKPTVGLQIEGRVRKAWWSVGLGGRANWPRSMSVGEGDFSTSLLAGVIDACDHVASGSLCAIAIVGAIRTEGHKLDRARLATPPYCGIGLQVAWDIPISDRLAVQPTANILGTVASATIQVSGKDVWRTPAFSGDLAVFFVARSL